MEGWITLHRSLLDHAIWQDEPFTRGQAWVDLLLLANHEPRKTLIGGDVVELEVGSYVTTIRRLSERWFRSIEWVAKYLRLLESEKMIHTKIVGKGRQARTILLLVNYKVYQFVANANQNAEQNADRSQTDHKANAERTQDGGKGVLDNDIDNIYKQQWNNDNNGTMEKEVSPSILTDTTPKGKTKKKFVPPTLEELDDYCYEQNLSIDPQEFLDFYDGNGWMVGKNHMKDWKATARNWDRRRKTDSRTGNYKGVGKNARAAEDMHNGFDMIDSLVERMERKNDIS